MEHQWLELGLMMGLALTCGGIGLVAGRYLNATGGCCGGGGHGHHDAPPPDPIRRELHETPRLVLGPFVPPADLAPVDHTKVPVLNREEPPAGDVPS